jgi:hypothetical protein
MNIRSDSQARQNRSGPCAISQNRFRSRCVNAAATALGDARVGLPRGLLACLLAAAQHRHGISIP